VFRNYEGLAEFHCKSLALIELQNHITTASENGSIDGFEGKANFSLKDEN
jgi:hypothetical protein